MLGELVECTDLRKAVTLQWLCCIIAKGIRNVSRTLCLFAIYMTQMWETCPAIPPQIASQPVRQYPLREVSEPSIFVIGERMGQKEFPQQRAIAAVVNQNAHVAQAEQRRDRERREGGYVRATRPTLT